MSVVELWNRLRDRLRRPALAAELQDELRFHEMMLARDNQALGLSPEMARHAGHKQLGNTASIAEAAHDRWSLGWIDDLIRDARYAMRTLRRAPVFVAIALLCLTLGIGANAAIFSVIDGVLLRPLPFVAPARIVRLFESETREGPGFEGAVSWPNFRDWRAQSNVFSALAAYRDVSSNLLGDAEAQRLHTVVATSEYFRVYGVAPIVGRTFSSDEDESGRARVVVLGERLWRTRFGADPHIVGRSITLDGEPYSVIGVMPGSFSPVIDAWMPYTPPEFALSRGSHYLRVAARLKPGVSAQQASAQMNQISTRLEALYPKEQTGRGVLVESLSELATRQVRPALLVLLGAVGLVLLIACANVANLLLARAAARQQEVSIRLALGASGSRLVRQFFVESLVLAVAGTLLGALLAKAALGSLVAMASDALPFPERIGLNGHVVAYLALVALAAAVAFGLAPAAQLRARGARTQLSGAGRRTAGHAQQRVRNALVVGELALSVVLLIGAVLLIRGFALLLHTDAGLDPRNVLTAHLSIPVTGYDAATINPKLLTPILDRVRAIPGVTSAGLISILPVQEAWANAGYYVPGEPLPGPGMESSAEQRLASAGAYRTLGVPLVAGRDFDASDGNGGHVAIINESLARAHFAGVSPLGRTIEMGGPGGVPITIVGVVGDVRQAGLDHVPLDEIDMPYLDTAVVGEPRDVVLVMKSQLATARAAKALRDAVRAVAPQQPVYRLMPMQQVLDESLTERRLDLVLLLAFSGVALALSAAGLYGVISYLVAQRTQEIGIRMALGARREEVVRLMLKHGLRLSAAGLVIGLGGAAVLSRALRSLLYGVSNSDPATYATVAVLLAAVAMMATWIPARRAARVNPAIAMRAE